MPRSTRIQGKLANRSGKSSASPKPRPCARFQPSRPCSARQTEPISMSPMEYPRPCVRELICHTRVPGQGRPLRINSKVYPVHRMDDLPAHIRPNSPYAPACETQVLDDFFRQAASLDQRRNARVSPNREGQTSDSPIIGGHVGNPRKTAPAPIREVDMDNLDLNGDTGCRYRFVRDQGSGLFGKAVATRYRMPPGNWREKARNHRSEYDSAFARHRVSSATSPRSISGGKRQSPRKRWTTAIPPPDALPSFACVPGIRA